jgi:dihydroneopterin aldolase/2-amino-4-hydroxy-6-hydroxymethyldihydropteridine diphosphokinase
MSAATSALDADPAGAADVVLALGANLGDRAATLRSAVAELSGEPGIEVRAVSGVWETPPVGGPEQPDYLNAVVLARTRLSPRDLLAACHRVEAGHGRRREVRWGPRTLDIDVITYADLVVSAPDLQLPHPRAAGRAFVLAPWNQADPVAVLPGAAGGRVADLLRAADDRNGVRPRPEIVLGDSRVDVGEGW